MSNDKDRPMLTEGDIILPYRSSFPIMLFENYKENGTDTFIKARKHKPSNLWFSDIDEKAIDNVAEPRDPHHWKSQGLIVFLINSEIPKNYGIKVSRVYQGGLSARGTLIELPRGVKCPYDFDTQALFKPIN